MMNNSTCSRGEGGHNPLELCFVCDKPIVKKSIPINSTAYPDLKELVIRMDHFNCKELYDKKVKLTNDIRKLENKLKRDKEKLLTTEYLIFCER